MFGKRIGRKIRLVFQIRRARSQVHNKYGDTTRRIFHSGTHKQITPECNSSSYLTLKINDLTLISLNI